MKILHTSDWHLGRSLYGQKRYDEFALFLDWLVTIIKKEGIDILLIAGDIFDTNTPSNKAQELYYRFLCRVSVSCCRHVVVIAGNHDSPSFLNAPKELLRVLNVYVVGSIMENLEDEVFILGNDEKPRAIVCAVPYLRDRDIRVVEAGETVDDKNRKLVEGIQQHYAEVVKIAEQRRDNICMPKDKYIPIIAMGHLFTAGGKTLDGDGVRELYVGSLAHIGEDVFPDSIDYLALGHLHVSQRVGKRECLRYCGSPIPMGFGESKQQKIVMIVEFHNSDLFSVRELLVPCFQTLVRIVGSLEVIQKQLKKLKNEKSDAWLEIEYTGSSVVSNLREIVDEILSETDMKVLRIKNKQFADRIITAIAPNETLDDLNLNDVFSRCLDAFDVPPEERNGLTASYNEIVNAINDEDVNAE